MHSIRLPALLLSLFLMIPGAIFATPATPAGGEADYQTGLKLWQENRRADAMPHWLKAAEQGHIKAAYGVALMHNTYKEADMKVAARWFRVAADGGIAPAMHSVGIFYMNGLGGLTASEPVAIEWFQKGAAAGDTEAMVMLAALHDEGRGVAKDPAAALRWNVAAAEKGHPIALTTLGLALLQGTRGAQVNPQKAIPLLQDAAKQGSVDAMRILAKVYGQGFGVPADPVQSAEWAKRAAACGDQVICE